MTEVEAATLAFAGVIERAIAAGAETIKVVIEADPAAVAISSIRFLDDGVGYTVDQLEVEMDQESLPQWCARVVEAFGVVRVLSRSGFESDAIGQLTVRAGGGASTVIATAGDTGDAALLPLAGYSGGTEIMLRRLLTKPGLNADMTVTALIASLASVSVTELGGDVAIYVRVVDRAGRVARHVSRSLLTSSQRPQTEAGLAAPALTSVESLIENDVAVSAGIGAWPIRESDPASVPNIDDGYADPKIPLIAPILHVLEDDEPSFAESLPADALVIRANDDEDLPVVGFRIAGATEDALGDYLKQIGKVALLDAAEEVDLAKRIEAGLFAEERLARLTQLEESVDSGLDLQWVARDGQRAKQHLLSANLRLVVSLARRYTGRGMQFLDLIQEGNLGLIRAAEKFDYAKGFKFSTYATWWIRQSITRAMADQGRTIRIPVHMVERMNKLRVVQRGLDQQLGRSPSPHELATASQEPVADVLQMLGYDREPLSLSEVVCVEMRGEGLTWGELSELIEDQHCVEPADALAAGFLLQHLEAILDSLSEREAGVIRMRFGFGDEQPKTLDQIGETFGVTRERIRQIESKTMEKLRQPSFRESLRDYLDLEIA